MSIWTCNQSDVMDPDDDAGRNKECFNPNIRMKTMSIFCSCYWIVLIKKNANAVRVGIAKPV